MTESSSSEIRSPAGFSGVSVEIENIGGIGSATLSLSRGVTVLVGENATNRTSFLRAIAAGLGGSSGVLKRDADDGGVSLTVGGNEYTRKYDRTETVVRTRGDPYSGNERVVDLFVCLLNDNPIRRAVRTGGDLAELLLAPVDTDELEAEISELRSERAQIDEQLGEIKREQKRLPNLEEKRAKLEDQLEETNAELEAIRERTETSASEWTGPEEAESLLNDLEETQEELERTDAEIGVQRSVREDLCSELEEVKSELSRFDVADSELSELKQKLDRLQGRESEMSITINELSTVFEQNRKILAGESNVVTELAVENDTVDKLDPQGQSIECWTCGSHVQRDVLTDRLESIDEIVRQKRAERREIREQISEVRSKRDSIQEKKQRYEELRERRRSLERDLERRSELIEELIEEKETLHGEIDGLRAELEATGGADKSVLSDYERMSTLEYERGQIEKEIDDLGDEIDEIEYLLGKREDHKARREDLTERITSLRSRVEEIEKEAVETFNAHMEDVLDRLEYENVERVWLERQKLDDGTTFELHIVREDECGTVYEDSIDHLSESEREVIGLVVAVAGYLTHDVPESMPILLLDSLEAIDAERIAGLVEHFRDRTEFLLLALLEEDAAVLPESYDRVSAPDFVES